ncbi:hypothetical protein DO97_14810 [Neosynechococcus sphagnicola sy1]|uniref:Probable membrane transporter protein n=1 Tax=Neosynechococcus sphagnicola sy1 TaxID=1497020 RepID=A0A098TH31_9CYAN|nr:sulfite exporter TauE/SafE family protein [Neosynechococcus sphagnicola]KGF71895.1 hypothetical protein DO97_14810 [Neosynechococcus sphagnicola sy1]
MSFWTTILLFGLIVVAVHFLEGITGFGSTVLSMPLVSMLVGIHVAKPVLTLYTVITCGYVLIKAYKDIDWKQYNKMMLLLLMGLPIGILIYNVLPKSGLLIFLGVFMVIVSIRGILISFGIVTNAMQIKDAPALFLVFCGGIVHGAFASGGPLIIVYATEKLKNKSSFRATLCLIWVTLNVILLTQMYLANQITTEVVNTSLYGLIFLAVGTVLGVWAHNKIHNDVFTKVTYSALFIMGVITLITNIV